MRLGTTFIVFGRRSTRGSLLRFFPVPTGGGFFEETVANHSKTDAREYWDMINGFVEVALDLYVYKLLPPHVVNIWKANRSANSIRQQPRPEPLPVTPVPRTSDVNPENDTELDNQYISR